jgi:molybdopterin biosynthesis enzyme
VDPDDVTALAMKEAGVNFEVKGNPVQPGNNFTIGYLNNVTVCAVPAAAVFYNATALDVFLPKILIGEKITKETIAKAGHGGLCHFCKVCHFPVCPFGRFV